MAGCGKPRRSRRYSAGALTGARKSLTTIRYGSCTTPCSSGVSTGGHVSASTTTRSHTNALCEATEHIIRGIRGTHGGEVSFAAGGDVEQLGGREKDGMMRLEGRYDEFITDFERWPNTTQTGGPANKWFRRVEEGVEAAMQNLRDTDSCRTAERHVTAAVVPPTVGLIMGGGKRGGGRKASCLRC